MQDTVIAAIRDALAEVKREDHQFDPHTVALDQKLVDDLKFDSLSLVELTFKVERKLQVKACEFALMACNTLRDVVDHFVSRLDPHAA